MLQPRTGRDFFCSAPRLRSCGWPFVRRAGVIFGRCWARCAVCSMSHRHHELPASLMRQALPPILVTGAHRSGTSWVGRMLAAGGQAALINEPFNRSHPSGVMRAPVRSVYTYVCPENEAEYLGPMRDTLAYRYQYWAQLTGHPIKDLPRAARAAAGFLRGRLSRRRPLLKDP